jgi:DNA-binding NarL/FixJ family response regulator
MTQLPGTPPSESTAVLLTGQERAVLTASAGGPSVVEVARSLDLSVEAVRAALATAREKLGASSKLDAIRLAYHDGLIDPRAP